MTKINFKKVAAARIVFWELLEISEESYTTK